jgi:hypothetical protein
MLEAMAEVGEDESIVSWQPHGKAFRVHQPDLFARIVMPRFFKQQTKYKSFQRQLHMYGFQRIRKGMDTGAYFHTMFLRNKKSAILHMTCCKKTKGKKSSSNTVQHHASGEPNFYSAESNVDSNFANIIKSDPIRLQASATSSTNEKKMVWPKPSGLLGTVLTTGNIYHHTEEEEQALINSVAPSAAPHQLLEWMEQAKTMFSCNKEEASRPYHAVSDVSASEKSDDISTLLHEVNHKKNDEAGLFEGKRFFYVVETSTPMMEDFSAVVSQRGPVLFMPRSAYVYRLNTCKQ